METQLMTMDPFHAVKESDNVSAEWRRYGVARRRELLDNDRRNGGLKFSLNQTCSIHRYYQVAARALEQFHDMHLNGADLEETYIMGHRMLSFLTECLPKHPAYKRPDSADLRLNCREQLVLLREVLLELELQIDEEQCNRFVAEFDPVVDDDSDDEDGFPSSNATPDWVDFSAWKDEGRKVDSPTSETVTTSGTASVDHNDISSSDDSDVERQLNFSDYEGHTDSPQRMYTMDLDTDFLDRIANEDVKYETDSEAADSWAQDVDSSPPSASSGSGITCDPARLALNNLLSRVSPSKPSTNEVQTPKALRTNSPEDEYAGKHDKKVHFRFEDDENDFDAEIERYLSSPTDEKPEAFIESSMKRLNLSSSSQSPARQLSYRSPSSSAFSSFTSSSSFSPVEKVVTTISLEEQSAFFGDDDWVSFDGDDTNSLSFGS